MSLPVTTVVLSTIGSLILSLTGPATPTGPVEFHSAYRVFVDSLLLDTINQAEFRPGTGGGQEDVAKVKELLAKGANPNVRGADVTVLYATVSKDRADLMELLLKAGADVNGRHAVSNQTALHPSARYGQVDQVKLLLQYGATVDAKDIWGHTPLHEAAYDGQTEAVRLLLAAGANVNARASTNEGETPLLVASHRCDCPETVSVLLAAGADVNGVDDMGNAPLDFAALEGRTQNVAVLLKAGADINHQGAGRATALINAAAFGHTETVRLLLANGADVTYKNAWGKTALTFAIERGYTEIADLLRAAGAKQ